MLDERSGRLLETINKLCDGGGFKIAEAGELLSCFPPEWNVGADELGRILSYLEERRFIDIQYAEEGVYCLCPLPEGRSYFETARERALEGARRRREQFLLALLGAFLGALLGTLTVLCIAFFAGRV